MANNDAYADLLTQLSKYDLLLEQLQKSMGDGFYSLSRANYHNKDSLRGRYGMDYWDQSYEGQLIVEIDNKGKVNVTKRVTKEEIVDVQEHKSSSTEIRRRTKSKKPEEKKDTQVDPISMFGASLTAPISLRQCQTNFKGGIPLMVELINCKCDIQRIMEKIKQE